MGNLYEPWSSSLWVLDAGKHWCWQTLMLADTDAGRHWCWQTLMLANTDAGRHWCWQTLMLANTEICMEEDSTLFPPCWGALGGVVGYLERYAVKLNSLGVGEGFTQIKGYCVTIRSHFTILWILFSNLNSIDLSLSLDKIFYRSRQNLCICSMYRILAKFNNCNKFCTSWILG